MLSSSSTFEITELDLHKGNFLVLFLGSNHSLREPISLCGVELGGDAEPLSLLCLNQSSNYPLYPFPLQIQPTKHKRARQKRKGWQHKCRMLYLLANSPLSLVSGESAFPNHKLSDHEQQTSIKSRLITSSWRHWGPESRKLLPKSRKSGESEV